MKSLLWLMSMFGWHCDFKWNGFLSLSFFCMQSLSYIDRYCCFTPLFSSRMILIIIIYSCWALLAHQKQGSTENNNFSGVCYNQYNILANGFECFIYVSITMMMTMMMVSMLYAGPRTKDQIIYAAPSLNQVI